jgi:hypothetical protein
MAFAVLHATKIKGSMGGLGAHIDRKHIPENAVAEKTPKNMELCQIKGSMKEDIDERIKEGYKGKKAIRKDAVKGISLILSGSHERMKEIESDPLTLMNWAKDNYQYLEKTFGRDNLVRCTLHMDEKTPHIHAVVVPITEDGRLTAKHWLDGRTKLKAIQTDYAESMAKWGLERGVSNEKRKHITTPQFYKYITENELDAKKILGDQNAIALVGQMLQELQGKEKQLENLQKLTKSTKENHYQNNERAISKPTQERTEERKPDQSVKRRSSFRR